MDPEYVLYLRAPPGEEEEAEEEQDEDEEEEEEEDGSDEEEEDDGDEVEVIENIPAGTSASVPVTGTTSQGRGGISQGSDNLMKVLENGKGDELCSCSGKVGSQGNVGGGGGGGEEIEGLFCPICMEAWTNAGLHQVCCLPCGHLYGLSCIKRWLRQCQRSGKCPQCKRKCTLKDVRLLYATQICVADDELPKKIQTLEAKCASLEKKNADCWKTEAALREEVLQLREKCTFGCIENKIFGGFGSKSTKKFPLRIRW